MKNMIRYGLSLLLALVIVCPAGAAELKRLDTAWMPEFEAFVTWYAKQKGWDKEQGLDVRMLHFESGKRIVNESRAFDWAVAGIGAVPAVSAHLSDDLYVIAQACDETATNAVYVRKDSPILAEKGVNAAFPNVYGSAKSLDKAHIIGPVGTSGHYVMLNWLKALGVKSEDVKVKNMDLRPALNVFARGEGQAIFLWAPDTYLAEHMGFKEAANAADLGLKLPVLLVADREFADEHPQQIEQFLTMYLRTVDALKAETPESLAAEYVRFYKEWAGRDITPEMAIADIKGHTLFSKQDQLALFDISAGQSEVQKALQPIVAFYKAAGQIDEDRFERLEQLNNVTDTFLRKIQ